MAAWAHVGAMLDLGRQKLLILGNDVWSIVIDDDVPDLHVALFGVAELIREVTTCTASCSGRCAAPNRGIGGHGLLAGPEPRQLDMMTGEDRSS